jgi:FG-GAP-like repeat
MIAHATYPVVAVMLTWLHLGMGRPADQPPVFEQTTIPTGKGPRFITATDVNHDGKLDLVVANADGGSVTLLLGDGKGGLTPARSSPFPAGHLPNDVATADLDHDGHVDLVIANHQSPYLTILLGDGKGDFRPGPGSPVDVQSDPHPHGVAVGAFGARGELGVVTDSWRNNRIELLEGDGAGGLRTPGRFFLVGRHPYERLRSADFNRDGRPDVVTTNLEDDSVTVLLGDGKGGLREAEGSPFPAGQKPWQVAIDDFDGDGKADLAVIPYERDLADPGRSAVTILSGDGRGGFSPLASPSLSLVGCRGPCSIATGDVDGDGRRDIAAACAESKNVAIFLNRGKSRYERILISKSLGWGAVALADLNGDGKVEVITANCDDASITVFLGK